MPSLDYTCPTLAEPIQSDNNDGWTEAKRIVLGTSFEAAAGEVIGEVVTAAGAKGIAKYIPGIGVVVSTGEGIYRYGQISAIEDKANRLFELVSTLTTIENGIRALEDTIELHRETIRSEQGRIAGFEQDISLAEETKASLLADKQAKENEIAECKAYLDDCN